MDPDPKRNEDKQTKDIEDENENKDTKENKDRMTNNEKEYEFFSKFHQRDANYIRKGDQVKEEYKFWKDQPVPQIGAKLIEEDSEVGPIDNTNDLEKERKIPYKLPNNHTWFDVNIKNKDDLNELYEFLKENYVEDEDNMFRFDYSKEFLTWHLTAPGCLKHWLCSVKRDSDKKMVGFISAIPVHLCIYGKEQKMVEINFLCVNKTYRDKRLAPVLIKEITRRVHCENLWQAVYTAGVLIPTPISKCTYYHRNLNVQKLVDIKFTYLHRNITMSRAKNIYSLSKNPTIDNLREMKISDVNSIHMLLNNYLKKFKIHAIFSKEEVAHWFLPIDKVVYTYVKEDPETLDVTDFFSFYSLPSTILQHIKHKSLNACYSFFNVATTVEYKLLIRNALIMAKIKGFDVYNCLNIMENQTIIKDLLFGEGDGTLKYYFYNFKCPQTNPEDLSLVLM
jgi:glycylpeptide N-tetradecanoyltransferase